MEQLWVNPNPTPSAIARSIYGEVRYGEAVYGATSIALRVSASLDMNAVRVASEIAPKVSPAPVGNGIVPDGWVLQMGDEGEWDTMLADDRSGSRQYRANITQPTVPYYTGGWPPDPLVGTPGHTPPTE